MSDILVQNNDPRDYCGRYRVETPRSANENKGMPILNIVRLRANDITRVPEEIWMAVVGVNGGKNTIADKVAQGRVIVLNAANAVSPENAGAVASAELAYQQFLSVYKGARDMGGVENKMLEPHLSRDGVPSFEMVRKNIGDTVNGDTYAQFSQRLRREMKIGMHSKGLVIPGAQELIDSFSRPDATSAAPKTVNADPYADLLAKLHDKIVYIQEAAGFGTDGKPKLGKLKEHGIEISREQRDHLWELYVAKYGDPTKEEAAE